MMNTLNYNESQIKKKKRNEIMEHGMNIFIRESIHNVTMLQIANECDISLRSLYYYYKNKEELAVDIQICIFSGEFLSSDFDLSKSAYEIVVDIINHLYTYSVNNQKIVKYITAFDCYFQNEYPSNKYSSHLEKIKNTKMMEIVSKKAAEDNSIETFGEDVNTTVMTVIQSMFAYSQRFIYREKAMKSEATGTRGSLDLFRKQLIEVLKKR